MFSVPNCDRKEFSFYQKTFLCFLGIGPRGGGAGGGGGGGGA